MCHVRHISLMSQGSLSPRQQAYFLRNSLDRLLNRHSWTLKELSDRSGVPYETVKKLANAKISRPSLYSLTLIAEAFSCSLDELAGRTLPRPEPAPAPELLSLLKELSRLQIQLEQLLKDR